MTCDTTVSSAVKKGIAGAVKKGIAGAVTTSHQGCIRHQFNFDLRVSDFTGIASTIRILEGEILRLGVAKPVNTLGIYT